MNPPLWWSLAGEYAASLSHLRLALVKAGHDKVTVAAPSARAGARLDPSAGPLHRPLPASAERLAPRRLGGRRERPIHGPEGPHRLRPRPETHPEPSQVRGSEGGRLADPRPEDRAVEEVGLELTEEVVLGGAAVHAEHGGPMPRLP